MFFDSPIIVIEGIIYRREMIRLLTMLRFEKITCIRMQREKRRENEDVIHGILGQSRMAKDKVAGSFGPCAEIQFHTGGSHKVSLNRSQGLVQRDLALAPGGFWDREGGGALYAPTSTRRVLPKTSVTVSLSHQQAR